MGISSATVGEEWNLLKAQGNYAEGKENEKSNKSKGNDANTISARS